MQLFLFDFSWYFLLHFMMSLLRLVDNFNTSWSYMPQKSFFISSCELMSSLNWFVFFNAPEATHFPYLYNNNDLNLFGQNIKNHLKLSKKLIINNLLFKKKNLVKLALHTTLCRNGLTQNHIPVIIKWNKKETHITLSKKKKTTKN